MTIPLHDAVRRSWQLARSLRQPWEPRWQRLFDLAMPYRAPFQGGAVGQNASGQNRGSVYDETGMVGVDEFAARLQSGIMPPGLEWAQLEFDEGQEATDEARAGLAAVQGVLFRVLSRSNMAAAMKDSLLDLCGPGTHCVRVTPGPWSQRLRFQPIALSDLWLTPGPHGSWADVHVRYRLPRYAVLAQWPDAVLDPEREGREDAGQVEVIDSWVRDLDAMAEGKPERWMRQLHVDGRAIVRPSEETGEAACPYVVGRWGTNPGELYGIGQGMQALPAIEVANELVRLVLANADMQLSGMWQAEDDGVLNPWSVQLVPGSIIPIAPGSRGLQPLQPGGARLDLGQLMLKDHQHAIRKALFNEQLGPREGTPVTAFEIQERMNELARAIGPAYERVWQETVVPLLARCLRLLREQGVVKMPALGEGKVRVVSASAFVRAADYALVRRFSEYGQAIAALYGPQVLATLVPPDRYAEWSARKMSIPADLLFSPAERAEVVQGAAALLGAGGEGAPGMGALLSPSPVSVP